MAAQGTSRRHRNLRIATAGMALAAVAAVSLPHVMGAAGDATAAHPLGDRAPVAALATAPVAAPPQGLRILAEETGEADLATTRILAPRAPGAVRPRLATRGPAVVALPAVLGHVRVDAGCRCEVRRRDTYATATPSRSIERDGDVGQPLGVGNLGERFSVQLTNIARRRRSPCATPRTHERRPSSRSEPCSVMPRRAPCAVRVRHERRPARRAEVAHDGRWRCRPALVDPEVTSGSRRTAAVARSSTTPGWARPVRQATPG